jgi:hypothetical protein
MGIGASLDSSACFGALSSAAARRSLFLSAFAARRAANSSKRGVATARAVSSISSSLAELSSLIRVL